MTQVPPVPSRRPRRGPLVAVLRFVISFFATLVLLLVGMGLFYIAYHFVRAWLAAHYGFQPE